MWGCRVDASFDRPTHHGQSDGAVLRPHRLTNRFKASRGPLALHGCCRHGYPLSWHAVFAVHRRRLISMLQRYLYAYRPLYIIAALCLVLRSLVAPGLMVVGGAEGFVSLTLVLCPAQNRNLDFDRLANGDNHHLQHYHDYRPPTEDAQPLHSEPVQGSGVHAESLDVGCVLWAGSATAPPRTVSWGFIAAIAGPDQPGFRSERYFPTSIERATEPRAPPIFS